MLAHAAAAALLAIAVLPPVLTEAAAATVLAPAALSSVVAKASFAAAVLAPAALPKRTGLPGHARFLWWGGY